MVSGLVGEIRSRRELVNKKRPSSPIWGGGNYTPDGEKVMVSRLVGGIRSRRELINKGRPSSSIWGGVTRQMGGKVMVSPLEGGEALSPCRTPREGGARRRELLSAAPGVTPSKKRERQGSLRDRLAPRKTCRPGGVAESMLAVLISP